MRTRSSRLWPLQCDVPHFGFLGVVGGQLREMGVGDLFCGCCSGQRYQNADTYLQPLNIFQPRSAASLEELLEKSSKAREQCWESLGSLEPLVLSHLINPALNGGPKWPALRQSFRLIRRPNGNVLLVSDGLSDPFDDVTLGMASK